jgi:hypothetical protein
MSAEAADMVEGLLRMSYRETVRHDQEVHAYRERVRLQVYALELAKRDELLKQDFSASGGRSPAEVLSPFRR